MALNNIFSSLIEFLPKVAGAIVVLIIGWIAGRIIGKGVSTILDKAGVDDYIRKTVFGRTIEKSGVTVVRLFDLLVRSFFYLIAVFAAIDILEIRILSEFMMTVVGYLPNFIVGVFVLIFGFILIDWIADNLSLIGSEAKMEYSHILVTGLRLFLYFIVLIVSLTLMKIDVEILYIFANALAWGAAIGIALGLCIAISKGFKDVIAKSASKWFKSIEESAEGLEERTARKARFEMYKDASGQFRFRLKAPNNEIILVGEAYTSKAACMKGIRSVKRSAPLAEIED